MKSILANKMMFLLLGTLLLTLAACGRPGVPSPVAPVLPGATNTPQAAAPTQPPTATTTAAPSPTATTEPLKLPVVAGTAYPTPKAAFGAAQGNAAIVEMARWGDGQLNTSDLSPDGALLALGTSQGVRLLDTASLTAKQNLEPASNIMFVHFSRDGKLVSGQDSQNKVTAWQVEDGKVLFEAAPLQTDLSALELADIAPDGRSIAIGGQNSVAIHDIQSGRVVDRISFNYSDTKFIQPLFGSGGGLFMLSGSGELSFAETSGSEPKPILSWNPGKSEASLTATPDHSAVAIFKREWAAGMLYLFSGTDGRELFHTNITDSSTFSIAFSSDSRYAAVATTSNSFCVWNCKVSLIRTLTIS